MILTCSGNEWSSGMEWSVKILNITRSSIMTVCTFTFPLLLYTDQGGLVEWRVWHVWVR